MTPSERIQRLREETARAAGGHPEWQTGYLDEWTEDEAHWVDACGITEAGTRNVVVYDEGSPDIDQSHHIARWDPQAAARALDLAEMVLTDHEPCAVLHPDAQGQAVRWCHREDEQWPCRRAQVALALLDTIDPEGAAP